VIEKILKPEECGNVETLFESEINEIIRKVNSCLKRNTWVAIQIPSYPREEVREYLVDAFHNAGWHHVKFYSEDDLRNNFTHYIELQR